MNQDKNIPKNISSKELDFHIKNKTIDLKYFFLLLKYFIVLLIVNLTIANFFDRNIVKLAFENIW